VCLLPHVLHCLNQTVTEFTPGPSDVSDMHDSITVCCHIVAGSWLTSVASLN